MQKFLLAIFLLCFGIGYSQHPGGGYCELESQNKTWFYQFKKAEDMETKVDMVKDKILSDLLYFEENPEIANLDDRRVMGPLPCVTACSIRFGIVYSKSKGLKLDLQKNPELEDLVFELNSDNVDRIELKVQHRANRYSHGGATKRSGVLIYTEDKELKKMIRRAIRDMEKS